MVRLYRSRYLHLEADLVYHRPAPPGATQVAGAASTQDELAAPVPTLFRMTTSRRMRSRELHYLDHPLFGLIVLVTPFESTPVEEPPPEDPVTT